MKVGDLVRWKTFGDIGIVVSEIIGHWKPYCQVYLLVEGDIYFIHLNELEIVYEKKRQEKEKEESEI